MSVHHLTEADLRKRALDHACPDCGAAAGVRCRIVTKVGTQPGYRTNTKVDVRPKPCPDRAQVAWREWLHGEVAAR
jgi:predicted RNA-binding Zn-ribbon protein involved in translation (DUF1610 family)